MAADVCERDVGLGAVRLLTASRARRPSAFLWSTIPLCSTTHTSSLRINVLPDAEEV